MDLTAITVKLRDANNNPILVKAASFEDIEQIEERLSQITIEVPYFQQAAQFILFAKTNTNTYPVSMRTLREQDNLLIDAGAYLGLTLGEKAQLLIDTVTPILDL